MADQSLNYATACDGETLHIVCDDGYPIFVREATYQQETPECRCTIGDLFPVECSAKREIVDEVRPLCNTKSECSIYINGSLGDPCEGIASSFLDIHYLCEGKSIPSFMCTQEYSRVFQN